MSFDTKKIAKKIAQRLRAIAVKKTVPIRTGELRNSIHTASYGDGAIVGTNKIYARAVHEGRPGMIIRPKNGKGLFWEGAKHPMRKVFQKARKGKPFFRNAVDIFEGNLEAEAQKLGLTEQMTDELAEALKAKGLQVQTR